jgi:hypothetical protein
LNEITELRKKDTSNSGALDKYWKIPASKSVANNNSSSLVTNLSFGMTLTLARAMGAQSTRLSISNNSISKSFFLSDPILVKALFDYILQTLSNASFDMTASSQEFVDTANSMWSFVEEFLTTDSEAIKGSALSILLALALRVGSVSKILQVVKYLLKEETLKIDQSVYPLINLSCEVLPNFNLFPPHNKVKILPFIEICVPVCYLYHFY